MKRIIAITLSLLLCACVFGACAKNPSDKNAVNEKLQPTEKVNAESLLPDETFIGDFKNEKYSALIEKNENDEMVITIISEENNTQWTMSGYFGYETYRINYDI